MSSTDKKDFGELEESMSRRFQNAEAVPDPNVWLRIDHALAMQENAKYKKRVLFYRQLAAACFILFILAGSALVLHFKQDREQALMAAATMPQKQPAATAPAAANPTIAGTATEPTQEAGTQTAAIAEEDTFVPQPQASGYTYDKAVTAVNQPDEHRNTSAKGPAAEAAPKAGQVSELLAVASDRSGNTSAGVQEVATERSYVPAGQAIASVPDDYTSPTGMNPLLRRNATLGTYSSGDKTQESINLQKQSELALALNTPAKEDKEESTDSNSRWNIGMGYSSAYFSQNINIPGYTITPHRILFNPDQEPQPKPKPYISMDSEENMRDARIEFQENTQAAMSYNVEVKTGFKLGKRLKLLTGLGYNQNSSKTKTSYIVEQFVFKPRTNERYKLNPTTVFLPSLNTFTTDSVSVVKTKQPFDVDYKYEMLSVPLGVQVEGKLGPAWYWYATSSMAVNFLMQTSIKAAHEAIASVTYGPADDSPFRKVQFSGNVGMGIGKRLSNAVNISAGPEYRSFLQPMLTDENAAAAQGRPYTIGLNMAVNYSLGQQSK